MDKKSARNATQAKSYGSASFGASDDVPCQSLADNKKIIHITEFFAEEGSKRLSSFLRKKITIALNSISTGLFKEIEHDYSKMLMLGFQAGPGEQFGFIMFDFLLLHSVINLLYGGKLSTDEQIIDTPGRTGIQIARKVSDICLQVFQDALNEHLKTDLLLSNLSTSLYSVFNQKFDACCDFAFNFSMDAVSGVLHLVIPESILVNITSESGEHSDITEQDSDQDLYFSGQLKHELIDSKVTICAMLPDISLLVKDVVNLRAGDVIPIGDPTLVYIAHNQKKLFSAIAGQSSSRRIVEIIDTV